MTNGARVVSDDLSTGGVSHPATILVVDDHRYARDAVRALFQRDGYRVLEAADGEQGLALARSERPDCVLLDIRLPVLSGFDVLDQLRQDPRTREIPTIMLTGEGDSLEGMERAFRGGAVDYLTKPLYPQRIAVRVRGAIERRRLLQEVQELRANFTSMLVHDLRSPVTVINAYADLLEQGGAGEVSPRQRRVVKKIQDSCGRMTRLISEILDLSKLEVGKLTLDRQPLNLAAVAADVLERLEPAAAKKMLTVEFRRYADPCVVVADAERIDQILMNLLGNALKFTPPGGSITVEVARHDDEAEVTVADSGPGIGTGEIPLLFEPFSQTSSARAAVTPGTGLGLVICRRLVEAHGGRIWAESETGRGARFVVRLPAVD